MDDSQKSRLTRGCALRKKPRRPGQVYHHESCDKKAPSNTRPVPEKKEEKSEDGPECTTNSAHSNN
jgi:hypothetical protein